MQIPIEKNLKLAQKYGIAFAWINSLEFTLTNLLIHYGIKERKECEDMMFGKKLRDADKIPKIFINDKIIEKLRELNKKRRVFAHGVTGEKVITGKNIELIYTGEYTISHKKEDHALEEFLDSVIFLAKEIGDDLYDLSLEYVKKRRIKTGSGGE